MARYIDVDKVELKGLAVFDENLDVLVPLSVVRKALQMTPTADVVPKSEVESIITLNSQLEAKVFDTRKEADILKSTIIHKEEEAYKKGYNDALKDVEEMIKNISEREK